VNIAGIAAIALLVGGAVMLPVVLAWVGYCLARRDRRAEGLMLLGAGALTVVSLFLVGYLTTPVEEREVSWPRAVLISSGVFVCGAVVGKAAHLLGWSWRRKS
jgi:hypothetical protein